MGDGQVRLKMHIHVTTTAPGRYVVAGNLHTNRRALGICVDGYAVGRKRLRRLVRMLREAASGER